MATSIIKFDGDTAWESGTGNHSTLKYRLRNGMCTITALYSGSVTVGTGNTTAITLAEEYRPTTTVYFPILNRASNTPQGAYGIVQTDGKVILTSPTGNIAYFQFCVSYPVK